MGILAKTGRDCKPYEETVALCGTNFWANLLTNPKFRESRNYWQATHGQRTAYWDQVGEITQIVWNGVRFIKYPAYTFGAKEEGKTALTFPANKAYVFPIGIPGKFMTQFALGDFNELTPEDVGLKYYTKVEQEYIQVGSLFWKDEAQTGTRQYNDDPKFLALPTQKYARRCMTADIQYSVAFYMNPMYPGCLPEWCDMASPIPRNATAAKRDEEERKLLEAIWK